MDILNKKIYPLYNYLSFNEIYLNDNATETANLEMSFYHCIVVYCLMLYSGESRKPTGGGMW